MARDRALYHAEAHMNRDALWRHAALAFGVVFAVLFITSDGKLGKVPEATERQIQWREARERYRRAQFDLADYYRAHQAGSDPEREASLARAQRDAAADLMDTPASDLETLHWKLDWLLESDKRPGAWETLQDFHRLVDDDHR